MFGAPAKCPRCDKSVYAAEQIIGPGRKFYHKSCLLCMSCNRRLDSYSLVEHNEEPYCKTCHSRNFGTRDLRHQNHPYAPRPRSASIESSSNGGSSNPSSPGRSFPLSVNVNATGGGTSLPLLRPTRALSPTSPTFPRSLSRPGSSSGTAGTASYNNGNGTSNGDSGSNLSNGFSSNHAKGPSIIPEEDTVDSFTSAAQQLSSSDDGHDADATPASNMPSNTGRPGLGNIPRTVPLPLDYGSKHRSSNSIDRASSTNGGLGMSTSPYNAPTFGGRTAPTLNALNLLEQEGLSPVRSTPTGTRYGAALGGGVSTNTTGISTNSTGASTGGLGVQLTGSPRKWGGGTPVCPKCSKNVYFAEQVKAVGKTYHKSCLRCMECGTSLDSTRLRDHDGEPYCMRCYNKLYGPQGAGYALLGKAGG